jgi:hypothetical protein
MIHSADEGKWIAQAQRYMAFLFLIFGKELCNMRPNVHIKTLKGGKL